MPPPPISPYLLRWFRGIVRGYFRRHFDGVRLRGREYTQGLTGPIIVYANHCSWWDPMVAFLLAERLFPQRAHYAPMDAAALRRYRILARLGVFPVELNSPRGAARFLRTGEEILAGGGMVWITPQGRFTDVRERPLVFKPGLARLATRVAARHEVCTVLPLAIEYVFWDERQPEVLLQIGAPVVVTGDSRADSVEAALRTALVETMDSLTGLAVARDPRPFETVLTGRAGIGGLYGLGKRVKAFLLRRPYVAEHTPPGEPLPTSANAGADAPVRPMRPVTSREVR